MDITSGYWNHDSKDTYVLLIDFHEYVSYEDGLV